MVRASKKKQVVELEVESIAAPVVAPLVAPLVEPVAAPVVAPLVAPLVEPVSAPVLVPAATTESTVKPESKKPTITSINATLLQHSTQLESNIEKILTENSTKMEECLFAHTTEVINLLHANNRTMAAIMAFEENRTIYPKDDVMDAPLELPAEEPAEESAEEPAEEEQTFFSYYQPFVVGFITGALASMFRTSIVLKRPFFL